MAKQFSAQAELDCITHLSLVTRVMKIQLIYYLLTKNYRIITYTTFKKDFPLTWRLARLQKEPNQPVQGL